MTQNAFVAATLLATLSACGGLKETRFYKCAMTCTRSDGGTYAKTGHFTNCGSTIDTKAIDTANSLCSTDPNVLKDCPSASCDCATEDPGDAGGFCN